MTDTDLLDQFRLDKNQQWIGILLERYTLLLLGVCMKYLKNEEEAKDCVQQIFLKVLTEVQKYKIEYFKSWLYMVAKNQCLMKLRGQYKTTIQELTEDTMEMPEDGLQDVLAAEHVYLLLEEALMELNEEQRQCITLFYIDKKSYLEVSHLTGFNLMQVKSHIQNGKRKLKLLMERKIKQNNTSLR